MFLVLAHHAAEFSFEDEFELDELFHLTAAFAAGEKRTKAIEQPKKLWITLEKFIRRLMVGYSKKRRTSNLWLFVLTKSVAVLIQSI